MGVHLATTKDGLSHDRVTRWPQNRCALCCLQTGEPIVLLEVLIFPHQIAIGAYTHLIYGFMSLDPNTFAVIPESSDEEQLFTRFTGLKRLKPGLQTWLSIGGWSFNDPGPTAQTFSQLVGSSSAQSAFFSSLLSFMQQYGFDGVDIDWLVISCC